MVQEEEEKEDEKEDEILKVVFHVSHTSLKGWIGLVDAHQVSALGLHQL